MTAIAGRTGSTLPAVSLLVCTYDQARELELVLAGLERQTWTDFDLWICDDGSGPETQAVISAARDRLRIPVTHVWHEHRGFRRAAILNAGLRRARGRLIVFIDGDCIPHRHFLRDHAEAWEPGRFLAGRRVNLGAGVSRQLTPSDIRNGMLDRPRAALIASAISGGTRNLHRAFRLGSPLLRRLLRRERPAGILGSNFSVARADLERVNGYDEAFEGYGHEDTELEIRLTRLGLRSRALRSVALQFHLWHPKRFTAIPNAARMEEALRSDRLRCERGLADSRLAPRDS